MAAMSRFPLILVPPGGFASTFVGINFLKVIDLFKKIRKLSLRHGGVIAFLDEIDSLGNRGGLSEDTPFQIPTVGQALGALLRFEREPYVWKKKWIPGEPSTACTAATTETSTGRWEGVWVDRKTGEEVNPIVVTGGGGMNMGTLESILAALDGMDEPRGLINKILVLLNFKPLSAPVYKRLIIGATNRLEAMDKALLRPGRLDYQIHVGFPDFEGKVHTYQGYLKDKQHVLTEENIEWAARNHHRGTGAEIKHIVNEAVLMTFRDPDREDRGVISFDDLKRATLWVRYGESKGQFEWERNRRSVAIHEASHAVAMHHLRRDTEEIWIAAVEQFGEMGGFVSPSPKYEDWKQLKSDMLNDIQVSLASRVGERLLVGEMSNGHGGDGPNATRIAEKMVRLGHGSTIGFYGPESRPKGDWQREVEAILQQAEQAVTDLLTPRTDQIGALADLLLEHGVVDGEQIHELLDLMETAA
jgi:ATP-dependent Zn protease